MWTDASGERRVDDDPSLTVPERLWVIAEALRFLDATKFASTIEKAKQLEVLLKQRDLQILPSIPEPRAIR